MAAVDARGINANDLRSNPALRAAFDRFELTGSSEDIFFSAPDKKNFLKLKLVQCVNRNPNKDHEQKKCMDAHKTILDYMDKIQHEAE